MSVIQLVLELIQYYQPCTVHSATLLIFTPTIITIMHIIYNYDVAIDFVQSLLVLTS